MISLVVAVLACSPADPETATFKGEGASLRQVVSGRQISLELIGPDGKARWKDAAASGWFSPVFSKGGSYVAEARTLDEGRVEVYGPDGKRRTYEPLSLVSEDEKSLMGYSSCGLDWFGGLAFRGNTLVVMMNQAPRRRPTEEPDPSPKLEVLIDVATGKLSRATPAKVVSLEGLFADVRAGGAKRAPALEGLMRKVQQPGGDKNPQVRALVREVLPGSTDASDQAMLLYLLDFTGTDEDREWVAAEAPKAKWPTGSVTTVLLRLSDKKPELVRNHARAAVESRSGDVNARAEAVRQAVKGPGGLKYVKLGLEDSEVYVRDAAGQAARALTPDDEVLAWLSSRANESWARLALTELFFVGPYGKPATQWQPKFEAACNGKMKKTWPGCEAWTGALADSRGELAIAVARYSRAAAAIGAELEKSPQWSSEIESFFRVHVRLAQLAKKQNKPAAVQKHLAAMKASKWWDQLRVDCSSGLPRLFDSSCDGGRHRDLLISELEGKTTR